MNRHWTPECIEAARNLARSDGALREELADRLLLAADVIEQLLRQRTQARESVGKVETEANRLREFVKSITERVRDIQTAPIAQLANAYLAALRVDAAGILAMSGESRRGGEDD